MSKQGVVPQSDDNKFGFITTAKRLFKGKCKQLPVVLLKTAKRSVSKIKAKDARWKLMKRLMLMNVHSPEKQSEH